MLFDFPVIKRFVRFSRYHRQTICSIFPVHPKTEFLQPSNYIYVLGTKHGGGAKGLIWRFCEYGMSIFSTNAQNSRLCSDLNRKLHFEQRGNRFKFDARPQKIDYFV